MSDAIEERSDYLNADIQTPEMEMAEKGAGVPDAADLALADINPANPHLFKEDRWQDHFARLRAITTCSACLPRARSDSKP